MNPTPLTEKIKSRLANLARTTHRLTDLLASADSLPPTHEMRLAAKLGDMDAELRDLVEITKTLLAVLVEEKP